MAPVLSGGATVSWFRPGLSRLLKRPARGVRGARTGPREPREAMAAACSLAARKAPGSSMRNGGAKKGWLAEGTPGPNAMGLMLPIGARTDPDGDGPAPNAGAANPRVPARRTAAGANARATRAVRATDQVDIECLTSATGPRSCAHPGVVSRRTYAALRRDPWRHA